MVSASPPPRTIIRTLADVVERNTAACAAELPPPTTITSWFTQSLASIGEAQYQTPLPS